MDKLNAISIFCRVVETQSFTQAAASQGISVPMASKLVSQLEEQLKTRLLQRTTRQISPTEAGLIYYQRCQSILTELEEADSSISSHATSLQGNLVISVPRDFGLLFITPNLPHFVKNNPDLHMRIEFSDRKVDLIAEGYDLALRIGSLPDSSLVARRIATSSIHVVASPAYLAKHGIPVTPKDLEHHNCLIYDNPTHTNWEFRKNKSLQRVKVQSKLIANNGLTLVELAKSGLGVINTPRFFVEKELQSGELVEVLADYNQAALDFHVIYPNRRHLSAKVKAFIDFLSSLHFCA